MRMKICNKTPEPPKMSLTIEYVSKENGMLYIRFDADAGAAEERVSLFCHDDDTGSHDTVVSQEQLKKHFIEIKRYMEES
jgi:RNA binding exosome subunit